MYKMCNFPRRFITGHSILRSRLTPKLKKLQLLLNISIRMRALFVYIYLAIKYKPYPFEANA